MDKTCCKCKIIKSINEFTKDKSRKDSLYPACKTCEGCRSKRRTKPEQNRNQHLKRSYGIDLDEYNRIFTLQEGKCDICKRHQSALKTKLHVDHCHASGKVRALLCFNCNQALGNVSDNIERLEAAIKYLRKHK